MIELRGTTKSGYRKFFPGVGDARIAAAKLIGVDLDEMVEVALNGVVYCYASQEDAEADRDGAYAVTYAKK